MPARANHREAPASRRQRARAAVLALLMAATMPTRAAAQSPAPAASRPDMARQAYAQRDFLRAARMYEALFTETHAAKFLYNAGMAREAAGHDAQALLHWREYLRLTKDGDADERGQLLRQMAAARRRTAPIRLLVASPHAATIELRYTADTDRDPLRITVQGRQDLDLEPGPWTAAIVGAAAAPQEFVATIATDSAPQEVHVRPHEPVRPAARLATVRPALPTAVDVESRRDWTRSLNVGLGIGTAVAGVGLLAAGTAHPRAQIPT